MKNIHLIATDKPTGIFQSNSGLQFSIRDKVRVEPLKGFHIYITSDEEIKEGDWVIYRNSVFKIERGDDVLFDLINVDFRKVILTTDQDLIKDGVQAIDDEFLEWFVENPTCEEVEVIELKYKSVKTNYTHFLRWGIIIPQEKSKQDTVGKEFYESADKVITVKRQEKKPHSFCETPEEKCTMNYCDENGCQNRVRHLVEPKQEQDKKMYNEEEVLEHLNHLIMMPSSKLDEFTNDEEMVTMKWFEQFKKK